MRPEEYDTSRLVKVLETERILTLDRIAGALGKPSRITVFRKLAQVGGRASYSHGGRYQTLDRIAEYDQNGLWHFRGVHFSRQGTLLRTIVELVEQSPQGYFAAELQALLEVRVHNALAHLHEAQRLAREQLANQYLYVSATAGARQVETREDALRQAHQGGVTRIHIPDEVGDSMRWLLSVLNEQQRRLYLGLESIRLGHGGDTAIARITGVNVKTIAQGRRQLQARDVTPERIRKAGAGRPPVKRKRRDGPPG